MKYYYDIRRQKLSKFKKREKVFLLQRNIKIKRLNKKLDHRKLRLFRILKMIKNINYKLHLLKMMQIHLVFHISLLKKVNQNVTLARTKIEDKTEYENKQVLEKVLIKK
jgi:hypothetical protein